jgi:hypothetical protein
MKSNPSLFLQKHTVLLYSMLSSILLSSLTQLYLPPTTTFLLFLRRGFLNRRHARLLKRGSGFELRRHVGGVVEVREARLVVDLRRDDQLVGDRLQQPVVDDGAPGVAVQVVNLQKQILRNEEIITFQFL